MPASSRLPWLIWLALGAFGPLYLAQLPQDVPVLDDWTLVVPALRGIELGWLFESHAGHRVPLPRLVLVVAMRIGGPIAARLASWLALQLAAVFFLLAARRARGRLAALDALVPVLLVGPRYAFSYLHAFDLHFGLQVLLAGLATWLLMEHVHRPRAARLAGASAALLAMLGCGVDGLVLAVALAASIPFIAGRRGLLVPFVVTLAACAMFVQDELYVRADASAQLGMFVRVTALPLSSWPGHLPVAGLGVAAVWMLWILGGVAALRGIRRDVPGVTIVAALGVAGSLVVWIAIAHVRSTTAHDGLRHAALAAQLYVFAHVLAASLDRATSGTWSRRLLRGGSVFLLVACLGALPLHVTTSSVVGAWFERVQTDLDLALRSEWTSAEIADQLGADLHPGEPESLTRDLDVWRAR